jgi:hypothetical protein
MEDGKLWAMVNYGLLSIMGQNLTWVMDSHGKSH